MWLGGQHVDQYQTDPGPVKATEMHSSPGGGEHSAVGRVGTLPNPCAAQGCLALGPETPGSWISKVLRFLPAAGRPGRGQRKQGWGPGGAAVPEGADPRCGDPEGGPQGTRRPAKLVAVWGRWGAGQEPALSPQREAGAGVGRE